MISFAAVDAEYRREYRDSEIRDILREREREIARMRLRLPCRSPALRKRHAAGGFVLGVGMGAGLLHGPTGPLIMAIREGLTVRGYYNPSVPAGVIEAGTVSQLTDLHTSANNYTQATAADQPAFTLNTAAILGRASFLGDGTSDFLDCATYSTPAPGTTPVYIRAVAMQNTWTGGRAFWGATAVSSTNCSLAQTFAGASPQMRLNNGTAGPSNSALALTAWGRIEAQYRNTTADFLRVIATTVTGTNLGNTATGTGRKLCGTLGSVSNTAFAFLISCEGLANDRFRTFSDWWTTVYFGPGLV